MSKDSTSGGWAFRRLALLAIVGALIATVLSRLGRKTEEDVNEALAIEL